MNFQYYVPRVSRKKRKFKALKLLMIVCFLLIFSLVIVLGVYSNSKHNKIFKASTFYFVCAFKMTKYKDVEARQDDIKKLGGAGNIYQKDKYYYMILNAYDDYESAKQVADLNKEIYPDVEILEVKASTVQKQMQREIKNNEIFFEFYKLFKKGIVEVIDLAISRLSGSLSENNFCSKILNMKFDFEEIKPKIEALEDEDIKKILSANLSLIVAYYNVFFNTYFDSDKKNSVVCDFVVSLTLVYVDFVNNL